MEPEPEPPPVPPEPEPEPEPENLFEKLRRAVAHQQQVIDQQKAHQSASSAPSSGRCSASGGTAPRAAVSIDDSDFDYSSSELPDLRNVSSMSDHEVAVAMKRLLVGLRTYGVSDLHISSNAPLFIRRNLALERLDPEWVVSDEDSRRLNFALLSEEQKEKFRKALGNDLNTSLGITALYDALKVKANDETKLALLADFDQVLSLDLLAKAAAKREADAKARANASSDGGIVITGEGDPAIDALVLQRAQAKKAKNFAEADRIRDELKAMGIEVTDTKEGASWRRM